MRILTRSWDEVKAPATLVVDKLRGKLTSKVR